MEDFDVSKYVTRHGAAAMLKCGLNNVDQLVLSGKLPSLKLDGTRYIEKAAVELRIRRKELIAQANALVGI